MKTIIMSILLLSLGGCGYISETILYDKYYMQVSPMQYPETKKSYTYAYLGTDNITDIYQTLFPGYVVIGKADFVSSHIAEPDKLIFYAAAKGADILITTTVFDSSEQYMTSYTTDTTNTTNFYGSTGSYIGSANTTTPQTTYGTRTINYYSNKSLFLRNINNIKPIQLQTKDDFACNSTSELDGDWEGFGMEIHICSTDNAIIAYNTNNEPFPKQPDSIFDDRFKKFYQNDLVFMLIKDTSAPLGIYLAKDKQPLIVSYKINEFGFLEFQTHYYKKEPLSFQRKTQKTPIETNQEKSSNHLLEER